MNSTFEVKNCSCIEQKVDVIVNAANKNLISGGGICRIIYKKTESFLLGNSPFSFLILYAKSLGKAIPACFRACSIKVDTAKLSWLQR